MQSVVAVVALMHGVRGDGYGHGISKNTFSASDPINTFNFLVKYFPAQCQDLHTPCNETIQCGTAGRGALCLDANCTYSEGFPTNFGIHTVNTSARPFGQMDNRQVEFHFTSKLQAAFKEGRYDAFMDFATVLYTVSLDDYLERFDGSVPHLLLAWHDERGSEWYSLLVQIGSSQVVFELVSSKRPEKHVALLRDPLQRLPAVLLTGPATEGAVPGVLKVLAVSKACSDLGAVRHFYTSALLASSNFSHSHEHVQLETFSLHGADAHVRFVQRPPNHTAGTFLVVDLEHAKHYAHTMAMTSAFCGVDKWIDNHFAYDQSTIKLDVFKANFDAMSAKYHIFGNCSQDRSGPGTNLYVVDPTGDSVQIDGDWDACPEGGAGDALIDACGQGSCSSVPPSQECRDQLSSMCGHVAAQKSLCSDCAYLQWALLESVGCSNADVVNYCGSPEEARRQNIFAV
jgi:hypothetical protein